MKVLTATTAVAAVLLTLAGALIWHSDGRAVEKTADIYVAQRSSGSGDGSSCGNARAVSFFNSAANWGSGHAIAPGTVVGLCGTITSTLNVMGNGSAGSPVTVLFTAGAKISQPVCGPCIYADGRSYITIDGGGSGQILSSANGTTLANHSNTTGISFDPCDHCTVQNLEIGPLYQHTSPTDENVGYDHTQQHAIRASGSYISFHDNNVHDVGWALDFYFAGGDGIQDHIYNNNVWNVDHGFIFTGSSPAGPVFFNNNHVHDFANWDDNNDENHHDGIHCFGLNFSNGSLYIYNNVFDGNMGGNLTGAIYGEGGCAKPSAQIYMFNNVVKLSGNNCCGGVGMSVGHTYAWNNTVISSSPSASNVGLLGCYQLVGDPSRNCTVENNVATTSNQLVNWARGTFDSGSPDYNVYADCQGNSCFSAGGAGQCGQDFSFAQFSNYVTCINADKHSITAASAKLNSNGSPQAGSPALGAATNLTPLCTGNLKPLCSDIDGAFRPVRMPPDAGAFQRETAAIGTFTIGRVRIGATRESVETFYGKRRSVPSRRPLFGAFAIQGASTSSYRIHRGRLDVSYVDGKVAAVATTSLYYSTRAGFGVGAGADAAALTGNGWRACGKALVRGRGSVATAIRVVGGRIQALALAQTAHLSCPPH
jgi:hypothetical protein